MEIRNHSTNMDMSKTLKECLEHHRKEFRKFNNVEDIVNKKCNLLNDYYRVSGLKSAVVAVSGGIDSAVVLGLVARASKMPNSPIERIVAVTMPAIGSEGVTGQSESRSLALEVCETFNLVPVTIQMGGIVGTIITQVEDAIGLPLEGKEAWARGQAVSYARTPTYYYITSILSAQGQPGLIIGTTNFSEGGYLGYFGKASDGMVDVQLISDLFKSEVYQIGRFLGVPEEILNRAPTGDMFDATTDEVVFGAPYDFVELFTYMKQSFMVENDVREKVYASDPETISQFEEFKSNLERMHQYNAHKYLGKSPAVHLDILRADVINGWNNKPWSN